MWTRRKFLIQPSRKNQSGIYFWVDPVSLTKERERILGIKIVRRKYYLPVVGEETMIAAVMKSQIKESCDTLKAAEKSMCPQETAYKNRLIIEKR